MCVSDPRDVSLGVVADKKRRRKAHLKHASGYSISRRLPLHRSLPLHSHLPRRHHRLPQCRCRTVIASLGAASLDAMLLPPSTSTSRRHRLPRRRPVTSLNIDAAPSPPPSTPRRHCLNLAGHLDHPICFHNPYFRPTSCMARSSVLPHVVCASRRRELS
jgi:hypothetical protein